MRLSICCSILVVVAAFTVWSTIGLAAPGDLATSFGTDGVVTTTFYGELDIAHYATCAAPQGTSKYILGGAYYENDTDDPLLFRIGSDRKIDTSFGENGFVRLNTAKFGEEYTEYEGRIYALAVASDQSIFAAGYVGGEFAPHDEALIVKFDADGNLAAGFGNNGVVLIDSSSDYNIRALKLLADGSILAAGAQTGLEVKDFLVFKLNSSGNLVPSFGSGGKTVIDIDRRATVNDLDVMADGKIILVGEGGHSEYGNCYAMACLNADGTLDTAFGSSGMVVSTASTTTAFTDVVLSGDYIYAAGDNNSDTFNKLFIYRFFKNGVLDATYGELNAIGALEDMDDEAVMLGIAPYKSDGMLAVGYTEQSGTTTIKYLMYKNDGTLDTAWHGTGKYVRELSTTDYYLRDAVIYNSRVLIAGSLSPSGFGPSYASAVVDYILSSEQVGSKTYALSGRSEDKLVDMAVMPDGSINCVGESNEKAVYAHYSASGQINAGATQTEFDSYSPSPITTIAAASNSYSFAAAPIEAFDTNILLKIYPDGTSDTYYDVYFQGLIQSCAIPSGGKPVFVGAQNNDVKLFPRLINLALDPSVTSGEIEVGASADDATVNDSVIQPDGKILVCGKAGSLSNYHGFVCRFNADGSPDTTFGTNGVYSYYYSGKDTLNGIDLQSTGKIIACGEVESDHTVLLRLKADGTLDSSFASGGTYIYDPGRGVSLAYDVAVQSNDSIIAAGFEASPTTAALWRFTPAGAPDTGFGDNGIAKIKLWYSWYTSVALLSDGSILCGGSYKDREVDGADYDFLLAKHEGGASDTPVTPALDVDGWWYTEGAGGTGLSMGTSDDGETVFLAWYVFDTAGDALWLVSWAQRQGETNQYVGDLKFYSGSPISDAVDGTVTLTFSDADNALLSWNMTTSRLGPRASSGSKAVTKYMGSLDAGAADPAGFNGWYEDQVNHPATGIFVEAKGNTLFLGWYHYRDDFTPVWKIMGGYLDAGGFNPAAGAYTATVYEYSGGQTIGGAYSPITQTGSGTTGTVTFGGGTLQTFTCGSKTYNLNRFTITSP